MKERAWYIGLMLAVVLSGSVQAIPVLDQEQNVFDHVQPRSLSITVGQSFTAGITGTLKQIDMGFFDVIDGDGTVEIYIEHPAIPGVTPFQMVGVQIYSEDNGNVNYSSFFVDVPIESGQYYWFLFIPNPSTIPNPYSICASLNDPYAGGGWFERVGTDWSPPPYLDSDLVFRTWVEPVPEPGTILLVGLGGLGLIRKRRV